MSTLVSVVIPVYNEAENIPILAGKVREVFDSLDAYGFECLMVNDGSTDGSREKLDGLHGEDPRINPIHFAGNFGQSAAVIAGMRAAKGEYILTLDGDLQNDPADFPRFLELLQEYDCVCGYRANRRDTWFRRFSSRVANAVRNGLLQDGIRDSGCGSKGFRRKCVRHLMAFNGMHRFMAVLIRAAGLSIVECPVTHHPRQHGVSKYGLNNRLWRGIYDLFGVAWLRTRYVPYVIEGDEPS